MNGGYVLLDLTKYDFVALAEEIDIDPIDYKHILDTYRYAFNSGKQLRIRLRAGDFIINDTVAFVAQNDYTDTQLLSNGHFNGDNFEADRCHLFSSSVNTLEIGTL